MAESNEPTPGSTNLLARETTLGSLETSTLVWAAKAFPTEARLETPESITTNIKPASSPECNISRRNFEALCFSLQE
jgi:hypothetical protein